MEISKKLRHLRKEKRVTVMELANGIGVSKQAIYDYENGGVMAPAKRIKQLADFFKVSTDYFYDESQEDITKPSQDENNPSDYLTKYIKKLEDDLNEALKDKEVYRSIAERLMGKFRASESSICVVKTITPLIEFGMIA